MDALASTLANRCVAAVPVAAAGLAQDWRIEAVRIFILSGSRLQQFPFVGWSGNRTPAGRDIEPDLMQNIRDAGDI